MSNQGPQLPSYIRPPSSLRTFEHKNEPEMADEVLKRAARQKNADKRFNSPFGFHEPRHKKVNIMQRYPKLFHRTFVTTCLLLFFSQPLYDSFVREPTEYELQRAEFLKKRMQATGWWDSPFNFSFFKSKKPEDSTTEL